MWPNDNYQLIQQTDFNVDFLQLYQLDPCFYPAFIESVSTEKNSKNKPPTAFDILFIDPQETLHLDKNEKLFINNKKSSIENRYGNSNNFLDTFNHLWKSHNRLSAKGDLSHPYYPFSGGWYVFLAYELANQIEPELKLENFDQQLPIAFACRYRSALIYDHQKEELVLFCEQVNKVEEYVNKISKDLVNIRINMLNQSFIDTIENLPEFIQEPEKKYLDAVKKIKQYIIDGDVFQVNLSRLWHMNINKRDHHELVCYLYQRLRKTNPAPFSALLNLFDNSVLSSSPERLVKVKNNIVESRPIAGTRPRGKTPEKDLQLIKQLHDHPKEKSEHIMLIDLIRNDLGRVSVPGSIHVDEFMVNESYQHVHHIVSNVSGRLAENVQPGDVIRAIFPGGTITGCPKIRCMEIIAELEQSARGAYTGSLGYINNDGSMDLNILIRTMLLQEKKNKQNEKYQYLSLRAGAGIVADSFPEKELSEAYAKAKGMLQTVI